MITLGITGQIAAGKSTAAREFEKFGGRIIFADEIGREVVEERPPILSKLVRAFGPEIVTPQGELKRKVLGRIVFASPEKREVLNKIVHPPLLQRLREELEKCAEDPECKLAIIDAALLIDWNWQEKMDYSICVTVLRETQFLRMREKGFTDQEIDDRINSQKTQEELSAACDFIIENNGSLEDLRKKVKEIYEQIKALQSQS